MLKAIRAILLKRLGPQVANLSRQRFGLAGWLATDFDGSESGAEGSFGLVGVRHSSATHNGNFAISFCVLM